MEFGIRVNVAAIRREKGRVREHPFFELGNGNTNTAMDCKTGNISLCLVCRWYMGNVSTITLDENTGHIIDLRV